MYNTQKTIEIYSPTNRIVYQRDANNEARVPVLFRALEETVRGFARLVPVMPGWGVATDWVELGRFSDGAYHHEFAGVKGGWYRLELWCELAKAGKTVGASVDRVGVGEVFMSFGHSCMQGGSLEDPGAMDDRASCVNYRDSLLDEDKFVFEFEHMSFGKAMGPWAGKHHVWGIFADLLIERLQVPVLIYGCAFGGTNIEQNYKTIRRIPFEHGFCRYELGMPYRPVSATLRHYATRTGIRGILCQHGGNDVGCSDREKFFNEFKFVIEHTRAAHGYPNLAFMLMTEGPFGGDWAGPGDSNINPGLADLVAKVPYVWQGPDYRALPSEAPYRPDKVHMALPAFRLYAEMWVDKIVNTGFLESSVPYQARW